jgi:23S rRNA (guanosine2251-2'-O)-methyltransferase
MIQLVVIAHNLRSAHNIGSLLRTAEGLGVTEVILSGYTPYPSLPDDSRLPHERLKVDKQISKTALGAEQTQAWSHTTDIAAVITELKQQGFHVLALEQTAASLPLPMFKPPEKLVLILGREVEGIEPDILALCEGTLEIPMFGQKESFNVVQAAAMALYHCRFLSPVA